ncbi:MAG: Rad52/Rad22 family DNA repair protein, partial [Pseudolabrys sp.]
MARSCTTCEHIKRAEIDRRLKAAETDATKRALATFGKPFGLELYRKDKKSPSLQGLPTHQQAAASPPIQPR